MSFELSRAGLLRDDAAVGLGEEPAVALRDMDHLTGLGPEPLRGGMAEMVKHGFVADPRTLHLLETRTQQIFDLESQELAEAVARSIRIKTSIVSKDLRESRSEGTRVGRELLNYGAGQFPLRRIRGTGTRIAGGSSRVKIHSGSVSMRAADRPATMATTPSIVAIPCATARLTSPASKYRRVRSADEPGTITSRVGTVMMTFSSRNTPPSQAQPNPITTQPVKTAT